ncbi:MAG: UDP-N-acetylmuramate dehydrogenase [Planctomycetes bacterium]|nr:UDP-N-acetylmuramate dehydrogenase [Planctomycetota bacterium]
MRTLVALSEYTTLRVGGAAAMFFEPQKPEHLAELLTQLEIDGIAWKILGAGANSVPADAGFDGAVIHTGSMRRIFRDGDGFRVWAGASLPSMIRAAYELELSGLENLIGVPGQLGGALAMNAGSAEWGVWDVVENVTLWVPGIGDHLKIEQHDRQSLNPQYRNGNLQQKVVLEALINLKKSSKPEIKHAQETLLRAKNASQPVTVPSAGCAFKNPPGDSAGRLLDKSGLKGLRVGGAEVSSKHANFIINCGDATAADVTELLKQMHAAVIEKQQVDLEYELVVW